MGRHLSDKLRQQRAKTSKIKNKQVRAYIHDYSFWKTVLKQFLMFKQ